MAAPRAQTEAEAKAEALAAYAPQRTLAAPEPVVEVTASRLAALVKRIVDLEARVKALEGP